MCRDASLLLSDISTLCINRELLFPSQGKYILQEAVTQCNEKLLTVRFSPLIDWQRKIKHCQQQQLRAVFHLNFPKHFEILS